MAGLIEDDTDVEMGRYNEAYQIKTYSGLSPSNMRGSSVQYDPVNKTEAVYVDLPSGGKFRIGDRPVTPMQVAETDAAKAAAVPVSEDIDTFAKNYKSNPSNIGGKDPSFDDYDMAGYSQAEILQYEKSRTEQYMAQPNIADAVKLTPDQTSQYAAQPGAEMVSDYQPPGMFEGAVSETVKGLARGGLVNPSKFLKENFNLYDPLVFQIVDPKTGEFDPQLKIVSREEKTEIDRAIAAGEMPFALDFEQLVQSDTEAGPGAKMIGGLAQFVGAFAGVGKLFKVGSGLVGAASQGAAADFLGFEGNEGRLTDLLLELGVPENRVTDFLRTDPNDPDYVGRFKNALEGGVLGVIADQIAPVYRMIKEGGSKTELGQAIGDLRFQSRQLFSDRLSDVIGAGRAIAQGDTEMLGEVFQRGRPPQSLSAAATGEIEDTIRQQYPDVTVNISGNPERGYELSRIVISENQRESGLGTRVMEDIVRMADEQGARISLTPETSFGGTSVGRLTDFYKRFGFVENKGRNKDFSTRNTMYRDPQPLSLEATQPQASTAAAPTPVDTSYRMQQQPRGPEDDLPIRLDDLTKSTTGENAGYPADFYSANGPRIYAPGPQFAGDEFGQANRESYKAIMAVRGKPDAEVTIYRAVPDDPKITTINRGDFVTLSPTYAKLHGGSGYGPKGEDAGKILSEKVKVKDIYFDGNDVNEFGYFPEEAAQGSVGKDILELNLKARPKLAERFKEAEVTADSSIDEIASTLLRAERSGIIDRRTADEIINGMKGQ
jgi:GNAT superfamily N-acetyltransferase